LEFLQRKEIGDILSYVRLLNNPQDDAALGRVINEPPRGIGRTTVQRIADHAALHRLSLLEAAAGARRIERIGARAAGQVEKFVAIIHRLTSVAGAPVEELLGHVLTESGYKQQFEGSEDEEDQQRLANIEELLTVAREFDDRHGGRGSLEEFLEETSLAGDTDRWESENDRVTLMTLHASKGLEFPVVYLVAVEQGLLPHERSREHPDQIEEERRLMFVGITRAREELQISMASYRDFRGLRKMAVPSQFLMELPRGEMELLEIQPVESGDSGFEVQRSGPGVQDSEVKVEVDLSSGARDEDFSPPSAQGWQTAHRPVTGIRLTTAAELDRVASLPPISPADFCQGMLVRHPEHGLGRIVALSGEGGKRKAAVDFVSPPRRLQFVITRSPLRPVKA
jgi:DNA helicase-2/ATP-dependent DNA helicase PcrA